MSNFDLSPPSPGCHPNFEALYAAAQQHARTSGYAIVVGGKAYKSKITSPNRKRKRETQKCNCPFSFKAKGRSDGSWVLCEPSDGYREHNHAPDEPSTFPEHRRFDEKARNLIKVHPDSGIVPSRTVTILRDQALENNLPITNRDIYNEVAKIVRTERAVKSPIEAFIEYLDKEQAEDRLKFHYGRDGEGHITSLFIADCRSIQYLNKHFDLLLFDCTYKTNRFGMPFLNVIGVDNMDNSFSIAIYFLDCETEQNYDMAIRWVKGLLHDGHNPSTIATDCEKVLMNSIDHHFPETYTKRVICYWHISKNILLRCKSTFRTNERWEIFMEAVRDVIFSKTEAIFEKNLKDLKDGFHWNDGQPHSLNQAALPSEPNEIAEIELEREALVYVIGQWLTDPHRNHVAHAWINRHFNAGMSSTSRLEGAHSVLKRWIGGPSKDLTRVWAAIKLAINSQLNEIFTKRNRQGQSTPTDLSGEVFYLIIGKISHFAIRKFKIQIDTLKDSENLVAEGRVNILCTYSFAPSMGMPCWHQIKYYQESSIAITAHEFHIHWHRERPQLGFEYILPPTSILEPINRQQRISQEADRRAPIRNFELSRTAASGRILSTWSSRRTNSTLHSLYRVKP